MWWYSWCNYGSFYECFVTSLIRVNFLVILSGDILIPSVKEAWKGLSKREPIQLYRYKELIVAAMQPQQLVLDGCCRSGKYICCILHIRIMTVQKKPISTFHFDFVKNDNTKRTVIHTQWCATPSKHAVDQAFTAIED